MSQTVNAAAIGRWAGIILTLLVAGPARAQVAIEVQDPGPNAFDGSAWTLGFEFSPQVDISVDRLGFFDLDADGLAGTHGVALWDDSGTLISSAFVSSSDPLIGFYRFSAISPVVLTAGNSYVVGSHDFRTDDAIRDDRGVTSTIDPDINIITGRWRFPSGSLQFPNISTGSSTVFYNTANFTFTRVPEMQSHLLMLIGLGLWAAGRRLA